MAAASRVVVQELLEAANLVASHHQQAYLGPCQRKTLTVILRRVRLMLPVVEEVRDGNLLLPPSAVIAFQELHSVMLRAGELADELRESSQLWLLAECELYSTKLFELSRDMAAPLSMLPLSLLELPIEIKEQVELLKLQARRFKLFVDPVELDLQAKLLELLKEFEKKRTPSSDRIEELFKRLLLTSAKECQRELEQLRKLASSSSSTTSTTTTRSSLSRKSSSRSPKACRINSLISFLCFSSCVLYGMVSEDPVQEHALDVEDDDEAQKQLVTSLSLSSSSIPDEYKCPISLELMRDPVIIATGQTYDRSSIQRWVEAGNITCPKSGQKLIHMTLIPNFALRSLIAQWCEKNKVPFWMSGKDSRATVGVDHIANAQATIAAARMTASFLVGKLAMGPPDIQRQAAYELRLLAKIGMENRRCIAEAGAIPFLVSLLLSRDASAQENAITALLNLSIFDSNKSLIMTAGALDPIVVVLCNGHSTEARENAAATIFSLSTSDENKVAIGNKGQAIPALVELLQKGTQTGKKDAVSALFNLSLLDENKEKVVQAGAVTSLVENLEQYMDDEGNAELLENSLALLGLLAASEPGAKSIARSSAMSFLVRILESGSPREKENATGVLLALCRGGDHSVVRCLLTVPGSITALHSLLASGSSRAKRKATSLMKILQNWDPSNKDSPGRQ
ncbi:U-box domain-containing protein 1 [Selaginella moellendorffii]|uniref:U-box domain-containing protein 1 n=1 Tax=Selaginella moellendorffii TaxID=88036 RepID=UPI000D1CAF0B|nr:U-box domain-containing protein 1 [Selaginella moellendorffii]|eukprot:XP_024514803.1 U-box domain-containing protein 1 [Selaginella moellendorffii]